VIGEQQVDLRSHRRLVGGHGRPFVGASILAGRSDEFLGVLGSQCLELHVLTDERGDWEGHPASLPAPSPATIRRCGYGDAMGEVLEPHADRPRVATSA
jgi:hypothetical protein